MRSQRSRFHGPTELEDKPVLNDYDIDDAINDVVCEIEWISMVASMRYIVLSNVPFI